MHNHVFDFLKSPQSGLAKIIETVQSIKDIRLWIHERLPAAMQPHCQVSLYHKSILTLIASSPAWATQLRFLSPELLQKLRQEPRWIATRSIEIKVNSAQLTNFESKMIHEDKGLPFTLSKACAEAFNILANKLDMTIPGNNELKKALERLSSHSEN